MQQFGLIGKTLSYSYSAIIHRFLMEKYGVHGSYSLTEVPKVDRSLLAAFAGVNITIPYKEAVIPLIDELRTSLPVINTIKNENEKLVGYNTDVDGFQFLLDRLSIPETATFAILGTGATSKMIRASYADRVVAVISRGDKGTHTYSNIGDVRADVLINTTPVGMNNFQSPIKKELLDTFSYVVDLNYNPVHSKLALDCLELDIPFIGGLHMLIVQAVRAFEIWHDMQVEEAVIEELYQHICFSIFDKIALIGMPLSGKTTLAKSFGGTDLDEEIIKQSGKKIEALLADGVFREKETETLRQLVKREEPFIVLGGGAVLNVANIRMLQDYLIIFLEAPLALLNERLKTATRPLLANGNALQKTYEERLPLYKKRSNVTLTVDELERWLYEWQK